MPLISVPLDQVSCSGSGSGSNQRALSSADQRATNKSRGAPDERSSGSAMVMPVVVSIEVASLSADAQAAKSSEY
jgi:hypothetical protein